MKHYRGFIAVGVALTLGATPAWAHPDTGIHVHGHELALAVAVAAALCAVLLRRFVSRPD